MSFFSLKSFEGGRRVATLGALALVGVAALGACADFPFGSNNSHDSDDGVVYGAAVTVGQGTARSYIVMQDGKPAEVGVALSEQALNGLPATSDHGAHGPMVEYLLTLPSRNPTPYKFVEVDWNPEGHEPAGIYTVPHFDFHFYTIPVEERNSIEPTDPQYATKARNIPAPDFLPARYISGAQAGGVDAELASVPRMGLHWIDPTSPELNGSPFTTTFIYGTWNGKLIFGEPMLTRAFLLTKPNFAAQVPTPQKVATSGYYPNGYRVFWNAETSEYRIALSGLTSRNN